MLYINKFKTIKNQRGIFKINDKYTIAELDTSVTYTIVDIVGDYVVSVQTEFLPEYKKGQTISIYKDYIETIFPVKND